GASPSNSGLTPKGMPTNYGAESTRFDFATTNYFQSNAASADNYLIKLASYTDTKWFQETKVADLGTLEKRQKGKYTIMLLKGYTSKDQALQALAKAKDRGFSGAYLVTQDSTGELSRVN
ncbi:MAG: SPOR domain-containing protein, partial [Saprospiraceae bacterium]|nr:SPOR domain-containing protein [Saprospiraceae bacterium]